MENVKKGVSIRKYMTDVDLEEYRSINLEAPVFRVAKGDIQVGAIPSLFWNEVKVTSAQKRIYDEFVVLLFWVFSQPIEKIRPVLNTFNVLSNVMLQVGLGRTKEKPWQFRIDCSLGGMAIELGFPEELNVDLNLWTSGITIFKSFWYESREEAKETGLDVLTWMFQISAEVVQQRKQV